MDSYGRRDTPLIINQIGRHPRVHVRFTVQPHRGSVGSNVFDAKNFG